MKSIKFLAVLMLLTVCSSFAISERVHPYIGAKGGFSFVGGGVERYRYYYDDSKYYNSSDITYLGSGSLGLKYRFLRIEFEYQYRGEAEQKYRHFPNVKHQIQSYLGNAFYDYYVHKYCSLYLGGGIGVSHAEVKVEEYNENFYDDLFTFQLDTGVSFYLGGNIALDMGMKMMSCSDTEIISFGERYFSQSAFDLYAGLRILI